MSNRKGKPAASQYGLEFALLIVLPVAVLLASAATLALAAQQGFTPLPEASAVPIVQPR